MANQCTVSQASLKPCEENTLCDGCRKSAESSVMEEPRFGTVAAKFPLPPKRAKRLRKFQIVECKTEAEFLRPVQETVSFKRS